MNHWRSLFKTLLATLLLTGCAMSAGLPTAPIVEQEIIAAPAHPHAAYDIVIYGGGPQAVATALKASAATYDSKKILMIVPEPVLGSIWTAGKQNIMDNVHYHSHHLPDALPHNYPYAQGGTFYEYYTEQSPYFAPDRMADYLADRLAKHPNITVDLKTDINGSDTVENGTDEWKVNSVTLTNGTIVDASVFVDASETGKLLQQTHFVGTIGRQDQRPDESTPKQMAATLMFKVRGVNLHEGYYYKDHSSDGSLQLWAKGKLDTPEVEAWNAAHPTMRLKPFNMAEDGYSGTEQQDEHTEFWLNMLLIYDVDATNPQQDADARLQALAEIKKPEFLQALRSIHGFEHLQLVTRDGAPVVGDELYLRESIHAANSVQGQKAEFALNRVGVTGGDWAYKAHRIGLGYYQFDNNTYTKQDHLRNPLGEGPWYVPYETLRSPALQNVLISGYAANIDSFAWTAMRVYPNLTVLGDAAGVSAGLASLGEFSITHPSEEQIQHLQTVLREQGAILDK